MAQYPPIADATKTFVRRERAAVHPVTASTQSHADRLPCVRAISYDGSNVVEVMV